MSKIFVDTNVLVYAYDRSEPDLGYCPFKSGLADFQ